jgi:hypothetical protein
MKQQEARFDALVAVYQQTVLRANAEVEDGLAMFLRSQERATFLENSVSDSKEAVGLAEKDYQKGATDFTRLALIELNLVQQQDLLAQTRGDIAQGLIRVYRALGGGWQNKESIDSLPTTTSVADSSSSDATFQNTAESQDDNFDTSPTATAVKGKTFLPASRAIPVQVCEALHVDATELVREKQAEKNHSPVISGDATESPPNQ